MLGHFVVVVVYGARETFPPQKKRGKKETKMSKSSKDNHPNCRIVVKSSEHFYRWRDGLGPGVGINRVA